MTKREFSQALRRGIGSAIIELQNAEDKSAYRDIVLRYCLRDISYDWQSEGTKGFYLMNAIYALDEQDYYDFEKIIIERFLTRCNDRLLFQLLSILDCYVCDGSELAKSAIREKYDYFVSKKGRLIKSGYVDEGFQWDEVANELIYIDGFAAFERYTHDIGEILHKNPNNKKVYYDGWYSYRMNNKFGEKRINNYFDKMYDKSKAVKAIAETINADKISRAKYQEKHNQKRITVSDLLQAAKSAINDEYPRHKTIRLRHPFIKHATNSDILELANTIVREENETVKALLLYNHRGRFAFPLEISPLLDYAQSTNELLAESAIDCLRDFKDKRIHDLAMHLLETKGVNSLALDLLSENYRKSDDVIIAKVIKQSASISHHMQMSIGSIYRNNRSANALPILLRIYREGECSYCREGIVRAMNHCGVLSDDILEECLFDSYDDTRKYAKRVIARRKARKSPR
jgi:hypothetical protein